MMTSTVTFHADAALFDMDGTLTDSIAAVEAAWEKVARDIGQDPSFVIAATHGKRAVDNLSQFKPHLAAEEIEDEVARFEESILFFADAHSLNKHHQRAQDSMKGVLEAESGTNPYSNLATSNGLLASGGALTPPSDETTPAISPLSGSPPTSRAPSIAPTSNNRIRSASFSSRLLQMLSLAASMRLSRESDIDEESLEEDGDDHFVRLPQMDGLPTSEDIDRVRPIIRHRPMSRKLSKQKQTILEEDVDDAWRVEAAKVDRSVRILPGVRALIDSIPEGKYAVATSGAKTYAYGCMARVGIVPPAVTITADDKRLSAGKPAPDPFLLAAKCLGFAANHCVVFEDSPSGIRAGVASGATVIAVCTSHERDQIEGCGAHYIVENLEKVACDVEEDGRLKFSVEL